MTRRSPWLIGLRALFRISRSLARIASAQERLADRADGIAPLPREIPDPDPEPITVAYNSDVDYARGYHVEQRLRAQLGRPPTAEEVCQEIDGIEWDPADPVAPLRRAPTREVH